MTDEEKIKQDINDIKNAINTISSNVRRIERALARDKYIPTRWIKIRYSHEDRKLIFNNRFFMKFEKNEADLLSRLFYLKGRQAGQPKPQELALIKIAKENLRNNYKPDTQKAVYQAYKRIHDRVLSETRIELFELQYSALKFNEFDSQNTGK